MKVYSSDSVPPTDEDHGTGASIQWLITEKEGAPNFAMRIINVKAGGSTPYHRHFWEHEVYVIEGDGVVLDEDGKETHVGVGDVVFIPSREKHQFVNSHEATLRFICVIPINKENQG